LQRRAHKAESHLFRYKKKVSESSHSNIKLIFPLSKPILKNNRKEIYEELGRVFG
jgi:hypothetical protein